MANNCYTGVTIPELEAEECNGNYTSDNCVIHQAAIPYLELPANSKVKDIINNLVLAIQNLQNQIDELQPNP